MVGSRSCRDASAAVLEQLITHGFGELASAFVRRVEQTMEIARERFCDAAHDE